MRKKNNRLSLHQLGGGGGGGNTFVQRIYSTQGKSFFFLFVA